MAGRRPGPAGLSIQTHVNGARLELELRYGSDWEARIARGAPRPLAFRDLGPWLLIGFLALALLEIFVERR